MEDIKEPKPIDKVTIDNLDAALRIYGIVIARHIIDDIIDIVQLLEEKGNDVTLNDIFNLKEYNNKLKSV